MFIMDVPVVPAQETPIVLVQADAPAGATPQPDYVFAACKETESTGDPRSAVRGVDPAGMLQVYIEARDNHIVELAEIKNVTMLQGTTVGKIFAWTDNEGMVSFHYDPPTNYVGNDKAIFMAEYQGKRYKIVLELHVFEGATPGDFGASTCPAPQLIKVTKPAKPSSGSNGYDLNSISVTFADLQGVAVGQSNANGITLDTNASGYGWFIDTTPADNSEFLPTSNPNEWVAKAGSATYGRMYY